MVSTRADFFVQSVVQRLGAILGLDASVRVSIEVEKSPNYASALHGVSHCIDERDCEQAEDG